MKVQVGILKYFKVKYFGLKYEPEAGRLFLKLRRKNDGRGQLWWRRSSKGASSPQRPLRLRYITLSHLVT